jgi:hypothetical protein
VHAIEGQKPREPFRHLGVRLHAEVLADGHERLAVLVEVAARANVEAQGRIFSSGA